MVPEPYTSEDVENAIQERDWDKLKEIWVSDPSVGVDAAGVIENRLNKQLQEPNEQVQEPKEQVQEPNEQLQEPNEQVQKPKEQVQEPNEQVQEPKEQVQEPNEQVQEPKEQVQEPNEQVQEPKEQVQEPNEQVQEPKEQVQEPNEQVQEPKEQVQEPKEEWDIPEVVVKDLIIDGLNHPSCFWAGRNVVFAKKYRVDICSTKLDELKSRSSSKEKHAVELKHAIDVYEGNMLD